MSARKPLLFYSSTPGYAMNQYGTVIHRGVIVHEPSLRGSIQKEALAAGWTRANGGPELGLIYVPPTLQPA